MTYSWLVAKIRYARSRYRVFIFACKRRPNSVLKIKWYSNHSSIIMPYYNILPYFCLQAIIYDYIGLYLEPYNSCYTVYSCKYHISLIIYVTDIRYPSCHATIISTFPFFSVLYITLILQSASIIPASYRACVFDSSASYSCTFMVKFRRRMIPKLH